MTDCTHERYRLIKKIGQGGMGSVYLAYDRKLAVERVVKEIRFHGSSDYQRTRQQFISEINIIRKIQHPCIPQIIDLFSEGDRLMIVMEKIEGKTLKNYVRDRGLVPETKAVEWGIQLAQILAYLHGKDPPILHRDLKPENVIIHPSGRLYLVDFGIAGHPASCRNEFSGTIGYAAPERYDATLSEDARGDIYSLGRVLSFCLFADPQAAGKYAGSEKDVPTVSDSFRTIIRQCTKADAKERYQSVDILLNELIQLEESLKKKEKGGSSLRPVQSFLFPRYKIPGYYVWILTGVVILIISGRCLGRVIRGREAGFLLECASETPDREEKKIFYLKSLRKAPWKEAIYQDILDNYVLPNHFSSREAASLINILQDTDALPALKKQNPEAYARFCYKLGVGYFYQMGGGTGKMESEIWFQRAGDMRDGLTKDQLSRASCYQKIGKYYRSFLYYGRDRNSEGEAEDYRGFYETLRQLTVYSLEHPGEDDQSAAWFAAYEVAEEIRDYAGHFLKEDEITKETLLEELEKIESFLNHLSDDVDVEKRSQLESIVAEAKKRVQIMEANYEKQNYYRRFDDCTDYSPDTGIVPEFRDDQ